MGTDQKVLFTIGVLFAIGLIVLDQLYKPEPKLGKPRKEREKELSFRPRPIEVVRKEAPHVRVGQHRPSPDERNVNVAHELYVKMSRPADLSTTEIAEVLISIPKDHAVFEQPKSWHHKVVLTQPFKYSDFQGIEFFPNKRKPATQWAHGFEVKNLSPGVFQKIGIEKNDTLYLCNYINIMHVENMLSCFKKLSEGEDVLLHVMRNGEERRHIVQFKLPTEQPRDK